MYNALIGVAERPGWPTGRRDATLLLFVDDTRWWLELVMDAMLLLSRGWRISIEFRKVLAPCDCEFLVPHSPCFPSEPICTRLRGPLDEWSADISMEKRFRIKVWEEAQFMLSLPAGQKVREYAFHNHGCLLVASGGVCTAEV